jgi:septal ring factor EnvC (AmiA/AmiB activator)
MKRQFKASDEALEESNVKLESLQIAFDLKDRVLEAKTREYHDLQHNLNATNQQFQKAKEQSVALFTETQNLRRASEPLNGQLRDVNIERQDLRAGNANLREANEAQQKQLQTMRNESLASREKLEDAQKTIERLIDRNAEDQQTAGLELGSQDFHAACEEEIERLDQKVQQLRETRDKLKAELREARKDALEGHASTREALRHMMSMRESESQPPFTPRRSLFGEPSGSGSRARVKRESVDEGDCSGTPTRGSKRIKQEEVIDLTHLS